MFWEGISAKDWIILGSLFILVVVFMIVLVVVYRLKYMNTLDLLKTHTKLQLNRYVTSEKETIAVISTMRARLQEVVQRHDREKTALETQVHELKKQLQLLNAHHVKGDKHANAEIEKVQRQMEELKDQHNHTVARAEQEIEMLKGQLNALRWRI